MSLQRNCASCGKVLDFFEWGANKFCPYCGKDTVKAEIKEIYVSFDRILDQVLRDALHDFFEKSGKEYSVGLDYEYISFVYNLYYGDISNPPYSNSNFYAHHGCPAEMAKEGIEFSRERLFGMDKSIPVYLMIWQNNAKEYMNFLYFAKEFLRFENVYLVKWIDFGDDWKSSVESFESALNNKIKLTNDDLNKAYERFLEIQSWNPECLVGEFGHVEPVTYAKLEKYVLESMTYKNYRAFGSIYTEVVEAFKRDTSFLPGYDTFLETFHRLMLFGKIKSSGECMWWGDSRYNNIISSQSFRLSKRRCKKYSYNDALVAVADAFELGYTYPLYQLLDESAVLLHGGKTFEGRLNIVEYIENDGSARILSKKQSVTAWIGKVKEGAHYVKDDVYLLVTYEKEGGREPILVKVLFEENKIIRLEMSKPSGITLVSIDE